LAALGGVTVRALHHYDRLGLLKAQRNASGFRIYSSTDLEQLETIIALKFIGLPLDVIREVLKRDGDDFATVLRTQITALEEKKRRLQIAIEAIRTAEATLASGGRPDLKHIVEVIEMQNDQDWMLRHFNESARPRVIDRLVSLTKGDWACLQREWTELATEIQVAVDRDPASPESQALLSRWEDLIRKITGNNQEIVHGLKSLYSDRGNWPEHVRHAIAPLLGERILVFIKGAIAARVK
jgi:DNA-binding transcriptional MerR regulator